MFEEATGLIYDEAIFALPKNDIAQSSFYQMLVAMRAERRGGFINDRGFRNKKAPDDKIGVTYAFWSGRDIRHKQSP